MWQPLASITLTTEWVYTPITDAIYFRLRTTSLNSYGKGYIAQAYEEDGINDIFALKAIYPFPEGEIIALPPIPTTAPLIRRVGVRLSRRQNTNTLTPWTIQLDYMPISQTELVSIPSSVANTATESVVTAIQTPVTILAANLNRKGVSIYNTSSGRLYLKFGAYVAGATNAQAIAASQVNIPPNGMYELPVSYTGVINGVFQNNNGNGQITEFV